MNNKTGDVIAFVFAVIAFIIIVTLSIVKCNAPKEEKYAMCAIVVDVSTGNDTVTIKDYNGNLWQFTGAEDWAVGDVCACVMDDNATAEIKDDEIISTRYQGTFSGWEY